MAGVPKLWAALYNEDNHELLYLQSDSHTGEGMKSGLGEGEEGRSRVCEWTRYRLNITRLRELDGIFVRALDPVDPCQRGLFHLRSVPGTNLALIYVQQYAHLLPPSVECRALRARYRVSVRSPYSSPIHS